MRVMFLLAFVALAFPSRADFLGIYAGAGYWGTDYGGDVVDSVDVDQELNVAGRGSTRLYVALEHPLPLVPNVRLERSNIDDSGTGTLATNFEFGGQNFSSGDSVATTIDLASTDVTLYYEIVDIGVDLDVGITARNYNGEVTIDSAVEALDGTIPMLYLRGKVGLPLSGLYFTAWGNGLAFKGNQLVDYAGAIGWETENFILPEFGVEAGYRRMSLDMDPDDINVRVDMAVDGFFVNLTAHF